MAVPRRRTLPVITPENEFFFWTCRADGLAISGAILLRAGT